MKLANFPHGLSVVRDSLIVVGYFGRLGQLIHHFVLYACPSGFIQAGIYFNLSPKMPKADLKTDNWNKITSLNVIFMYK